MAAGYSNLTVTRTASGVSWSFNATALSSAYYYCKVECESSSTSVEGLNTQASVTVTGSVACTDADYKTGRRVYTIRQYVRAGYNYEWQLDSTAACTVTWDVAALRVKIGSTVKTCTNIKVKNGSSIKSVIGVYSVENGQIKPGF